MAYDYSTNTTVSGGNVGAITGGREDTATLHLSSAFVAEVLDLTERVLAAIPDDAEHTALRAKVESIQSDVRNGAAAKETLLAKAGKAALLAGGTAAGQQVVGLLAQLGQVIAGG